MSSQDSDTDPSTDAIEAEFPRWHCWHGISGLLYASRQRTSPPLTVRDENTTELRAQIKAAEDKIASEYTFRFPGTAGLAMDAFDDDLIPRPGRPPQPGRD